MKGPHWGKENTSEDNAFEPDAKQRKLDGGEARSSAPKAVTEQAKQSPKTPIIIAGPGSNGAKEEDSEEVDDNIETCAACGQDYDGDKDDEECLAHDGTCDNDHSKMTTSLTSA